MKTGSKEIDNSKKLLDVAIKYSKYICKIGILFFSFVIMYAAYKIVHPINFEDMVAGPLIKSVWGGEYKIVHYYYMVILIAAFGIVMFVVVLKKNDAIILNFAVLISTFVLLIYICEILLQVKMFPFYTIKSDKNIRLQRAHSMNVDYDTRTKFEVIDNLRKKGVEAYPQIAPYLFIYSNGIETANGNRIYPLGLISNKTIVSRNETGKYLIYESDEHGFNNIKGLYDKDG
ncbi:MAG: hypothetical protein ABIK27_06615, partial [Bacteroidota bacterium]